MARAINVPPPAILSKAQLTRHDITAWPDYFLRGDGQSWATSTDCPHGYRLTDSCPGCDADVEERQ
jgi:hypothetical protein